MDRTFPRSSNHSHRPQPKLEICMQRLITISTFNHQRYQSQSPIRNAQLFPSKARFHEISGSTLGIPWYPVGPRSPVGVSLSGLLIPTRADSSPRPNGAASPLELRVPYRGRRERSRWALVVADHPRRDGKIT
jgi:hypothetical protein